MDKINMLSIVLFGMLLLYSMYKQRIMEQKLAVYGDLLHEYRHALKGGEFERTNKDN